MTRTASFAALAGLLVGFPLAAPAQQNIFPEAAAVGGAENRVYTFGDNFSVDQIRQTAFPLGVVVPIGQRFSFDIGTAYAITKAKTGSTEQTFSGFTDTQLRTSYVLGSDALVASVMVNLPTGHETMSASDFSTTSSASSNFLLFPVNSYGSGLSVTPGVAGAVTVGSWNLGLAGSMRWNNEFQPFSDSANKAVRYQPGLEGRVRFGMDRLVGSSRLMLGFTFSTFGTDEARGGGLSSSGSYSPGNRFLTDLSLLAPVGSGSISFYLWNYYRTAGASGDTTTTSSNNKEDVLTGGATGAFPIGKKVTIEPLVEGRFWWPEAGSGTLVGGGANLRIALSRRAALVPGGRFDIGTLTTPFGTDHSITGWAASVLMRVGF